MVLRKRQQICHPLKCPLNDIDKHASSLLEQLPPGITQDSPSLLELWAVPHSCTKRDELKNPLLPTKQWHLVPRSPLTAPLLSCWMQSIWVRSQHCHDAPQKNWCAFYIIVTGKGNTAPQRKC